MLKRYRISVLVGEKVLEMVGGDGRPGQQTCFIPVFSKPFKTVNLSHIASVCSKHKGIFGSLQSAESLARPWALSYKEDSTPYSGAGRRGNRHKHIKYNF